MIRFGRNMLKNQAGKILINSLITASLFGLIGFGFTDNFSKFFFNMRNARRNADMHQIQLALELYYQDNGHYPLSQNYLPTVFGWQKLMESMTSNDNSGPWLYQPINDPSPEKNIFYRYGSNGQGYEILYYLETSDALKKEVIKSF